MAEWTVEHARVLERMIVDLGRKESDLGFPRPCLSHSAQFGTVLLDCKECYLPGVELDVTREARLALIRLRRPEVRRG